MLGDFIAWLTVKALKSKTLSGQAKMKVTNALLDNVGSLPLKNSIVFDEMGTIMLNGKPLEVDTAIAFRESALALQDSFARKIVREQVRFLAIQMGIYQGLSPDTILFAKAALWYGEQEDKLLSQITGQ